MNLSSFSIGLEFWCSGRQWRCTDVGTRTVVAIRIDQVEITSTSDDGPSNRVLPRSEAEAAGWFGGPPYAVAEIVFDENDLEGCTLEPDAG